ncbi:acyl carrier protein [Hydrogenimonas thermophila]|uniref:acyl carrier protein n=1 Tax=Hydrogenimonas thermophila TaxID=223786 RepID=UPI002937058A|nr:acyl carrier protein [Hydrogenimonas thermophila]WOE69617.1 acyl carrier protein [Hydrogenimonas thermophila]WOE72131.1 acyl carrier protein [Hydrogenimonas thermophila]
MITEQEIFEKTKAILVKEFEVEEDSITIDADLFEDLGFDSLDAIDLVVTLDKELDVELKTEEMGNIRTIKDVCDFVNSKTAK